MLCRLCLWLPYQLCCPPHLHPHHRTEHKPQQNAMDLNIKGFDTNQHTVEVGADDTVEDLRRKVASAMGLPEDGFCMNFGGEAMGAGADMTQLSAGDTILLKTTKRQEAIAELHALGETDLTAERLKSVEDPEVACLLLQAEVATVIPKGLLSGTSLTKLDLSAESIVTHIGGHFLLGCTTLTSIDLSGLSNVTHVGDNFLRDCGSITTLDLPPLSNVTQINHSFLHGCKSLTTINLSSLSNVTGISPYFLSDCDSLTSVDLPPLFSNVTRIDHCFLHGCKSLTTVNLSSLSNVTGVSSYFLYNCDSLTSVDLTPLSNVTRIGSLFLYGCNSLTTLDLSPLSRTTVIEKVFRGDTTGFVAECASLMSIYLYGCSSVVSNEVRKCKLSELEVAVRPKRSRDESPEQRQKRRRHAQ